MEDKKSTKNITMSYDEYQLDVAKAKAEGITVGRKQIISTVYSLIDGNTVKIADNAEDYVKEFVDFFKNFIDEGE